MLMTYIFPDAFGKQVELDANVSELSAVPENGRNVRNQ